MSHILVGDKPQGDVMQRALWWAMFVSELLITYPDLRAHVPSGAQLFILPEDDEELCAYNKALLEQIKAKSQDLVVCIKLERVGTEVRVTPHVPDRTYSYAVA